MTNNQDHLETLHEIRSLMERSSRFISLSGLSGVTAGLLALAGAAAAYLYLGGTPFSDQPYYHDMTGGTGRWGMNYLTFYLLDAGLVLAGAVAGGIYFTTRKARSKGQRIWDPLTRRLLVSLTIPLASGGLFCLALLLQGQAGLVAPAMLLFYGLALINAGKYTLNDVHYLGLGEIVLGLTGAFVPGFGLELWALGFGVLHVLYGILMYFKYERQP